MNEWMNEGMNEWMNEGTNERMNECVVYSNVTQTLLCSVVYD
jgi:hypothetical protein